MGRKSLSGGAKALGATRIQFDFKYEGVRYRPSVDLKPTAANLRLARARLKDIRERIARGAFNFQQEFPGFARLAGVPGSLSCRTCNEVFDEFLEHANARMEMKDLAYSTVAGYRRILARVWRPKIGKRPFETVRYSELARIADTHARTKKSYNNVVSALRCAFEHGYRDHPEQHNPASGLNCVRITKKDKPAVDPFTLPEAETIIAGIHRDWGQAQGNYDEFRFFTGLRPSEEIALLVSDCDVSQGKVSVTKARVMGRDKDRTKTGIDRVVELCPRALEVLKRQLALRATLKLAGKIDHERLFFKENGEPIGDLKYVYSRWRHTLQVTLKARYRDPYNARHTSVSWELMIGTHPLRVAEQHGHSVQVMLDVYAAWIKGAKESDIEAIKQAMQCAPRVVCATPMRPRLTPAGRRSFGAQTPQGAACDVSDPLAIVCQ